MPSYNIPRGPLLILTILIFAVFVLRAFFSVPKFDGNSSSAVVYKTGSVKISMLTFNIWFSAEMMAERMKALGKIVQDLEPDILTFQEVTGENLALLQKQRWFSRYQLIPPDAAQLSGYFVVILSSFPVNEWNIYPFKDSPFQRKLVTAEIKSVASSPKNLGFVIATTHLEHSGRLTKLREEHLREAVKILSTHRNVCVMGDMNLERQFDGDVILPWPWVDAWLEIPGHSDSNGYTWDESNNPFIVKERESTLKDRLDRVFCKLSDFKVKEMRVVDNKMIKSGVLPSDHFGLFNVLELEGKPDNNDKLSQTKTEVYFRRSPAWEKSVKQ